MERQHWEEYERRYWLAGESQREWRAGGSCAACWQLVALGQLRCGLFEERWCPVWMSPPKKAEKGSIIREDLSN